MIGAAVHQNQYGALFGGISLAFVTFLREKMKVHGVKARFVRGGSTKYLVQLLEEGLTDYILDGQAFVVTHSDGYLLHGIGGWQDCLFAQCVILAIPSFRDRIPIIVAVVEWVGGTLLDAICQIRTQSSGGRVILT